MMLAFVFWALWSPFFMANGPRSGSGAHLAGRGQIERVGGRVVTGRRSSSPGAEVVARAFAEPFWHKGNVAR